MYNNFLLYDLIFIIKIYINIVNFHIFYNTINLLNYNKIQNIIIVFLLNDHRFMNIHRNFINI
jgi:hypothetical protein